MHAPTAPAGATATLRWTKDDISGVYEASAGAATFAITPHWTRGARGQRKLSHFIVTHGTEELARVEASEKAALAAAKRWANARYNALLTRAAKRLPDSQRTTIAENNAEQDRVAAYVRSLEQMTQVQLMDELESCVVQNHYGSHDAQKRLVRAELGQRCSH